MEVHGYHNQGIPKTAVAPVNPMFCKAEKYSSDDADVEQGLHAF